MKRTVNKSYCFIPMAIYFCYITTMSVRFGHSFFYISLILSALSFMVYLVAFLSFKKDDSGCPLVLLFIISLFLSVGLGVLTLTVGDDRETALIAGTVINVVLAFAFIFLNANLRSKNLLFLDNNSKKYYALKGGKLSCVSDSDAQAMLSRGAVARDLSNVSYDSTTGYMPIQPATGQTAGFQHNDNGSVETYLNPSSGLPMNGGMSGLDVAGNSWGTNFNDPANHSAYDPNRGY